MDILTNILIDYPTSVVPMMDLFSWTNGLIGRAVSTWEVIMGFVALVVGVFIASRGWTVKSIIFGIVCGGFVFFAGTQGGPWFGEMLGDTLTGLILR